MNGYVYCSDNPTNLVDPSGLLFGIDEACGIGFVIDAALLIFVATAYYAYMQTPAYRDMQDSLQHGLEGIPGQVQQAWNTSVPAIEKTAQDCVTRAKGYDDSKEALKGSEGSSCAPGTGPS